MHKQYKCLNHVVYGRPRERMVENQLKRKSLPHDDDDDDQRMLRCIFIDLLTIFIIIGLSSSSTVVVGGRLRWENREDCLFTVGVGWLGTGGRMLAMENRVRAWEKETMVLKPASSASSRRSAFGSGSEPICVYAKYMLSSKRWKAPPSRCRAVCALLIGELLCL